MTLEVRCADLGLSCKSVVKAETEDELVTGVAAHARQAHGVELTQTLADYARSRARTSDG